MTTFNAIGGTGGGRVPGNNPPGFSTLYPNHLYALGTNGRPAASMGTPTNSFFLFSGNTGARTQTITFGASTDRPTMPDWSPDGKTVLYVLPQKVAMWNGSTTNGLVDDDHEFGGSLYTIPYNGNGAFGTPAVFLQSKGENNFYPSYSPDNNYVAFDRVPQDTTTVTTIDGCVNQGMAGASCPNDSFSNPKARIQLMSNTAASTVVDLEKANGSPASAPVDVSNSWPRWSPFLQSYKGNSLLWIAFSSTRDYGLRVRNHKTGMYQCYPADSYEMAMTAHGSKFDPLCQQPQLWMAAIDLSSAAGTTDTSHVAFWLPFQDITTHNHTPQWTQTVATGGSSGGSSSGTPGRLREHDLELRLVERRLLRLGLLHHAAGELPREPGRLLLRRHLQRGGHLPARFLRDIALSARYRVRSGRLENRACPDVESRAHGQARLLLR